MILAGDDPMEALAAAIAGPRLLLIAESFQRMVGRALVEPHADGAHAHALWTAPRVVLAHGLGSDPVFFYGNRAALDLFEMDVPTLTRTPSHLSAEPLERDERARLLARVQAHGFIDDYSGVRVSRSGRRFRIEAAVVWNLVDAAGALHGQAATFDRWEPLGQAR